MNKETFFCESCHAEYSLAELHIILEIMEGFCGSCLDEYELEKKLEKEEEEFE